MKLMCVVVLATAVAIVLSEAGHCKFNFQLKFGLILPNRQFKSAGKLL